VTRPAVVALGWVIALSLGACTRAPPQLSEYDYPPAQTQTSIPCSPGAAAPPTAEDEVTDTGIKFSVRAPANYRPAHAHALLMVYAPAGYSRHGAERYYALTPAATAAGYVVVYADHRPLSKRGIEALAAVPAQVIRKWCIDAQRVYYLGHSDGGSVSMGIMLLNKVTLAPAAIVASGMGIRGEDFKLYKCPAPTAIMVMHSSEDEHFPGYGEQAATWWAQCNRCSSRMEKPGIDGCYTYQACAADTRFCPTHGAHTRWPGQPAALLSFLSGNARRRLE
jgi:polyhydroxybutyrate depolymerase